MASCSDDHFLIWQKSEEVNDGEVSSFTRRVEFDYARLNHFTNLIDNARLWPIEASNARTINPIARTSRAGQWTDCSKFVCGYFVIKGSVDDAVELANQVDRSFAQPYLEKLTAEALDDFTAHATGTYAALSGIDATIMTVWANNYKGAPRMPTDLAIGAITAYNTWGRKLLADGFLLDAGRMNVRHDATHVMGDEVIDGPYSGARLVGLGSYARKGRSPIEAVRASGLLRNDSSLVFALQKCNGYCKALSGESETYDNPKNEIFP